MIRFTLQCDRGHEFESWFRDSAVFETQSARGDLNCPHCGSTNVSKGLMAPNIASAHGRVEPDMPPALNVNTQEQQALRNAIAKIRDHVVKNADNVGDKFASEARKIHYDEVKPRGIYGTATFEEAEQLTEEGIDFHPLPDLPEDHN